ncbi:MAG: lipopolysaccharide biosynthesis protein [Caldilineaceae bacterium]|nr:lipopolysaccharide biosynthesis protein [Caldilineaceae bacterium]
MGFTQSLLKQSWSNLAKRLTNHQFLRNSALLMLANVIVTGLALIRTPAMTWLLPKEDVGMLAVVGAWLPFVQLLSLPGLDAATYHYLAKGQRWAFATNINYRIRYSLLSAVAFLLIGIYWWRQGNSALFWMFLIAGLTYPVTVGLTAAGGALGATENFVALFWYRLGESLTDFVGFIPLLLTIWWLSPVITFYAGNQMATAAMMIGVSLWLYRRLNNPPTKPEADAQAGMLTYGRHQTALSIMSVTQSRIDAVLIGSFLSLTVMADYAIGMIVSNQLRTIWSVYSSIRYPPLARMSTEQRRHRLVWEGAAICLLLSFFAGALYIGAWWAIPLLLPPTYATSLAVIGWLLIITIVGTPGGIVEWYFRIEQMHQPQYQMRAVGAVASILLPLLLLPNWGLNGVMGGRLLGNLLFSLFGIWQFFRKGVTESSR